MPSFKVGFPVWQASCLYQNTVMSKALLAPAVSPDFSIINNRIEGIQVMRVGFQNLYLRFALATELRLLAVDGYLGLGQEMMKIANLHVGHSFLHLL